MVLKKIVVAHPYQQHSFQTASAIKNRFGLFKYVTTVYDKKQSFTGVVKMIFKGDNLKRAGKRKCAYLDDEEVLQFCELESLILLLLYRIDKSRILYKRWNKHILKKYNRKLANYLLKNKVDIVILYDTVCAECIRILKSKQSKTKIIIDMSAPSLLYMDDWFKKSSKMYPQQSRLLIEEMMTSEYKNQLKTAKYELDNADLFFVASEFSKESLLFSGVNASRIFICRYGINIEPMKSTKRVCEKLRIVFIGNVTQKKGIIDFVKIASLLGTAKFEYTVVGVYDPENEIYKQYESTINFLGYVTHDNVLSVCEQMDIIIFPSLSDGFGLSVIEAMSREVLPIVSINAGVSDIISHDVNGYLFSPGEVGRVVDICSALEANRDLLREKQIKAFNSVSELKWENYYDDIGNAIDSFFDGGVKKVYE